VSTQSSALECGVDLHELARQVFEGAVAGDPEHQARCRYCQRALERIRAVYADLHGLAAERVPVPASLLRSVMARLRGMPALVTIDVDPRGTTTVSERVVSAVARRAARSVRGVSYASALTTDASPTGRVGLRVRLVVAYGPPLGPIAEQVREEITRQVVTVTGATLSAVHVAVDDLT